jgi:hypothetical protein
MRLKNFVAIRWLGIYRHVKPQQLLINAQGGIEDDRKMGCTLRPP